VLARRGRLALKVGVCRVIERQRGSLGRAGRRRQCQRGGRVSLVHPSPPPWRKVAATLSRTHLWRLAGRIPPSPYPPPLAGEGRQGAGWLRPDASRQTIGAEERMPWVTAQGAVSPRRRAD